MNIYRSKFVIFAALIINSLKILHMEMTDQVMLAKSIISNFTRK